jgi:hypothetical protein
MRLAYGSGGALLWQSAITLRPTTQALCLSHTFTPLDQSPQHLFTYRIPRLSGQVVQLERVFL